MTQKVYPSKRKIIHVDMDAFYASVEQRDFPELKGKAIAVGGGSKRGVITTASYEARKYGVRSAMPGFKARELCPHLIFVKPRFDAYKEASKTIRGVFSNYTELIEPLSLDEAYLDVTTNKKEMLIATKVAEEIQKEVFDLTQLTCSAGVSYCKFLAKIASDFKKPNGITVIKPHQAEAFIEQLEVRKFHGIGKVTARKMNEQGIYTGADLKQLSKIEITKRYGKSGTFFYDIVRGIDDRPVRSSRIRKSLGVETTVGDNIKEEAGLRAKVQEMMNELIKRIDRAEYYGKTLTLKIKTADFTIITRSKTVKTALKDRSQLESTADEIISNWLTEDMHSAMADIGIRLVGLTVSNMDNKEPEENQLNLSFE